MTEEILLHSQRDGCDLEMSAYEVQGEFQPGEML